MRPKRLHPARPLSRNQKRCSKQQGDDSMTKLNRWASPKTGQVGRIYVERKGLKAKLWFEKEESPFGSSFAVHYHGNESDFSVNRVPGEAVHITEARDALADLKLDIKSCTWDEIAAKAK
jgi:hypothetical protein